MRVMIASNATTRIHGASARQDLLSCISQVVSCP